MKLPRIGLPWRRSAPIASQIMLLILIGVVVAQLANAALVLVAPRPVRADRQPTEIARVMTSGSAEGRLTLSTHPDPPHDDFEDEEERSFRDALAASLSVPADDVRTVFMRGPGGGPGGNRNDHPRPPAFGPGAPPQFIAARRLPDGQWQWLEERPGFIDPWQQRALLWLVVGLLLVLPIGWYFARRFTLPIRRFAEAAEAIGRNPQAAPLAIEGPAEIEDAAAAFRLMQERLARYVDDRTGMVAGIAHDLRTPLTRLAFRLEALPDAAREAALADIEEMQAMISSTLDYVRGTRGVSERVSSDLAALIAAVPDDLAAIRDRIVVEPSPPLTADVDPAAIRRLLANLTENAVRHGGSARLRLKSEPGLAVIEVDDEGPGLPDEELERVFEPFHRGDPSRSRETGGHGLGLAIARTIAAGHGGTVRLENRPEGGLRAIVALPV